MKTNFTKQKVIVITGIGGMGLAVARRLGTGHHLLLADFNEDKLQNAAQALTSAGYTVSTQVLNIANKQSVETLAQKANALGAIKTIVHTAGLSPTALDADKIMAVNLMGTGYLLESFEPYLNEGTVGVVIASMAGHNDFEGQETLKQAVFAKSTDELATLGKKLGINSTETAYAVSKRANRYQVQKAASLWGQKGARVVSVSPGIICTPMAEAEMQEQPQMQYLIEHGPVKRIGTPEDIAALVAFLQSEEASFITGADVLVDGGATAFGAAAQQVENKAHLN